MYDPFKKTDRIELGMEGHAYFIISTNIFANVKIVLGDATTTARVMQENGVRFFDYHHSLANDSDGVSAFITAANHIGYAV